MTGPHHRPRSHSAQDQADAGRHACDICGRAATYTDLLDAGPGSSPLHRAYCRIHEPLRPRRPPRPCVRIT